MDDVARIMVNRSNMQYNTVRYAILRALNHMKPKITRLQPVVAEMGDRLATIHMCRKMGLLCPFPWGAGSPPNTDRQDRQDNGPVKQGERFYKRSTKNRKNQKCGPMPNVMVALPNIGGAFCSTPQSLADAPY